MLRYLALGLAFVLIVAVAVYDGVLNHRWTANTEAEDYAELIEEHLPAEIGDWKSVKYEVDDTILRVAGAVGYVSRSYKKDSTDEAVKVWLIVGPFKHVIRHTPDICYPSQDFRMMYRPETYQFDAGVDGKAQFLTSSFEKRGEMRQRVFWSWHKPSDSGPIDWVASTSPRDNRQMYAGTPALFKLYFTTLQPQEETPPESSPANEFAKVFLPVINELILS
ncbi:MAG: exosortase-associated EpsI family protein, partial [Planctomycetales bacterium]|nr:exosortase-associated EpsI family protein [Planctomycetales bacterium]